MAATDACSDKHLRATSKAGCCCYPAVLNDRVDEIVKVSGLGGNLNRLINDCWMKKTRRSNELR